VVEVVHNRRSLTCGYENVAFQARTDAKGYLMNFDGQSVYLSDEFDGQSVYI